MLPPTIVAISPTGRDRHSYCVGPGVESPRRPHFGGSPLGGGSPQSVIGTAESLTAVSMNASTVSNTVSVGGIVGRRSLLCLLIGTLFAFAIGTPALAIPTSLPSAALAVSSSQGAQTFGARVEPIGKTPRAAVVDLEQ